MMFDNSPPPTPSTWDTVRSHAPIVLLIGGALVLFVSLHTGLFAVAIAASLHVVLALGGIVIGLIRGKRRQRSAQGQS